MNSNPTILTHTNNEDNSLKPNQNCNNAMISRSAFSNFNQRYFGTKEVGVQTDLTGRVLDELLERRQDLQQEYALYQRRNDYDFNYTYQDNCNEASFLKNKRKNEIETAEIETSPQSSVSMKNHPLNRLDISHNLPFTETNASDLSSNVKFFRKDKDKDKTQLTRNSKGTKKKVDAYQLFKEEFKQVHVYSNEDELEKKCKGEWNTLSKDVKKFYNLNADIENRALRKQQRKNKTEHNNEEETKQKEAMETIVNTS